MILKKYKIVNGILFRRSKFNGHFKCGEDCKRNCQYNDYNKKSLRYKCDTLRGINTYNKKEYAYYPQNDIKEINIIMKYINEN